jgi:HK97 gp10 family phage protein
MIKITGTRELLNNIKRLGADAEKIERDSVFVTANAIKNHAVKSIQEVSKGRYGPHQKQGGGMGERWFSAAGDAPNTDTGNLQRSINIEPLQPQKTMYVGVNADYGVYLEFGTRNIKPRPFMQPAIDANQDYLEKTVAKKYKELLRR